MMNCVFTVDHRFGDAAVAVNIAKVIKGFIEDPENFKLENYPDPKPYNTPIETKK